MDEKIENKIEPVVESKEVEQEVDVEIHYKELSPMMMVTRRFFRSRLSMVGVIILISLFAFSFVGPPIMHMFGYKWGEEAVDYDTPSFVEIAETITAKTEDANGTEYEIIEIAKYEKNYLAYGSMSFNHIFGTDANGLDVFIRLMYGGRVSLTLGFVVIILETLIGIIMGGVSGYFGGWVDQIIMRLVDILNCIPTLPILLIASVVIDSWNVDPGMRIYYLMAIMTIFGWSGTARMVRGQILYLREQEFIVACEVMGIPVWRRIFKHLIPNIMPQLIVSMTLGLGGIILYESTLSYLGLGIPVPKAAWGTMISASTDPIVMANYPFLWVPAGILIVLAVLAFNFVGDGLRDAMDPKSKR